MVSIDELKVFGEYPIRAITTLATYPLTSGYPLGFFHMLGEGAVFGGAASYFEGDPGIFLKAMSIPVFGVAIQAGAAGLRNMYGMRNR